jgi:hypothetical protein
VFSPERVWPAIVAMRRGLSLHQKTRSSAESRKFLTREGAAQNGSGCKSGSTHAVRAATENSSDLDQ